MEVVANRFDTIDLTNEPATPPPSAGRASVVADDNLEDDDIVYVGTRRANSPLLPPRPLDGLPLQPVRNAQVVQNPPRLLEEPIIIESDDEDGDLLSLPPSRPQTPFRIFSPPADFIPERTRDAVGLQPPLQRVGRIGLGGGMMAIRSREPEARYHSQDAARQGQGGTGPARVVHRGVGWGRAFDIFAQLFNDRRDDRAEQGGQFDAWVGLDYPERPPLDRNRFSPGGQFAPNPPQPLNPYVFRPAPEEPADTPYDWKWTHPKAGPRPGFTFDFDTSATSASAPIVIDDDTQPASFSSSAGAGPSTTSPSTSATLICPRCQAGLVMGGRTMWGLRCGHVICGTCADYLGRPVEGKGKGKDVAEDEKGKGKVKEEPKAEDEIMASRPMKGQARRTSATAGPSSTRQLRATTSQATAKSKDAAPSRKRQRSPVKRKVIQPPEEHLYFCPVAGCHRPHWSVKEYKGDEETPWKPKDGVGSIPIFT